MERVDWPGNLLLRHGVSQRSFENEASSSALERQPSEVTNSGDDVDFDDVFGGPPTRTRQSSGGGRINSSEESTSCPPGLPVFGESYSSPRRKTSDDFYDDIFRKSEESVRSPRWSSTTPGSRTLSPTHPKIDQFAASVPAQFSLSAKMTKAIDIPVFGSSSSSPHRYKEGASNTNTPNTSLSRFLSVEESLYSARSTENEMEQKSKHKTARSLSPSLEFHFSMHKWANIGVPLLMSLRGGKHPTFKGSSKVSALSVENMQDADFQIDDLSADREHTEPHSESGLLEVIEKEIPTVKQEVNEHEIIPQSSVLRDEIAPGAEEADREAEGKENMERMSGLSNSDVGSTRKKKIEEKKTSSGKKTEANKSTIGSPGKSRVKGMVKDFFKISNQESFPKTKTNVVGRSVSSRWKTTGRKSDKEVGDSMLNSNSKVLAADVEMMLDGFNKALDSEAAAENVKTTPDASTTPVDSKVLAGNAKMAPDASSTKLVDNVNMMPDASFVVKERIERSNNPKFARDRTIKKVTDLHFNQMAASPSSESAPYGPKVTVVNIDDTSLENFQVQVLSTDDDKLSKTQEESEAIKAFDSKIHLWSNGRKGNIRSLLSTLQLVLWPESGWKPVALVDIIEANAVKKAYNRAMLYLHPDKLQQKGADSLKKYMAEKIFDVLQEAWDHFNSLGTLL